MPLCVLPPIFDNRWISVLLNNREEALTMASRGEQSTRENRLEDLTKDITEDAQRLPGNDVCCDGGSAGWSPKGAGLLNSLSVPVEYT